MRRDRFAAYRELIADVYQLAGRARSTSDRFAARHGQTVARWHVLSVVSDGPHSVPGIAERLGLTRQSVQRVVNELAATGLVTLEDNPQHRRSRLVAITSEGRTITGRLFDESARFRTAALESAGITAPELDRAAETIGRLLDAVEAVDVVE